MSIFSRNKFKKLKREDVVNAICNLEKQQTEIMTKYNENDAEIKKLFDKGRTDRDKNMQVYYAKRIQTLRVQNTNTSKRLQFLNANISVLHRLKDAIDDNEFIKGNSQLPLNELLMKPAQLQDFLNKVNVRKVNSDEMLEDTINIFDDSDASYEENERIYGADESVNNILAMFEDSNMEGVPDVALNEKDGENPIKAD